MGPLHPIRGLIRQHRDRGGLTCAGLGAVGERASLIVWCRLPRCQEQGSSLPGEGGCPCRFASGHHTVQLVDQPWAARVLLVETVRKGGARLLVHGTPQRTSYRTPHLGTSRVGLTASFSYRKAKTPPKRSKIRRNRWIFPC